MTCPGKEKSRRMTDTELGDKAEYYRKLFQHNYEIYQETGIRKYYRSYIRYEEISDAFSLMLHELLGAAPCLPRHL